MGLLKSKYLVTWCYFIKDIVLKVHYTCTNKKYHYYVTIPLSYDVVTCGDVNRDLKTNNYSLLL